MTTLTIILLAVFFITQVLDAYTTKKVLDLGGSEGNPILARVFDLIGIKAGLVLKMALMAWLGFYVAKNAPHLLPYFDAGTLLVVAWNYRNYRKMKRS